MQHSTLRSRRPSRGARRSRKGRWWLLAAVATAAAVFLGGGLTSAARHPVVDPAQYELVFDENFDTLDVSGWGTGTRWIAHTPWNGDFGDALFVDPEPDFPFTVENGILRIEASKGEDGLWRSGLLASSDPSGAGFHLEFGYFEMRAKLPQGPGVWPAFWLIHNTGPDSSLEIDVLEFYGHQPDVYHSVVHVWPKNDTLEKQTFALDHAVPSGSLSEAFHDYGVSVGKEEIVFYLDGQEMGRVPTPLEHMGPMFILLNLALGSGWPIEETPDPSFMYVDYVRAYRRIGE